MCSLWLNEYEPSQSVISSQGRIGHNALLSENSLFEANNHFFLSDLLPYDCSEQKGCRLKESLNEYLCLLTLTECVIYSCHEGILSHFDPLVGENACQIRALQIAKCFSSRCFEGDVLRHLLEVKQRINEILFDLRSLFQPNISLDHLLEEGRMGMGLTADEIFLVQCYLLTFVKKEKAVRDRINPLIKKEMTITKNIRHFGNVSRKFATDLVNKAREAVAAKSVSFVQELADQLPISDMTRRLVSDEFTILHIRNQSLRCIPCYYSTRIVLKEALLEGIPFVIIAKQQAKDREYSTVKKSTLFFKTTPNGYREVPLFQMDKDSIAIVVEGSTCDDFCNLAPAEKWRAWLSEHGPIELLSAQAASHRQYPHIAGDDLLKDVHDPEYKYYKEKAVQWGCSLEDPAGFLPSHIYCDKISNIVKTHKI